MKLLENMLSFISVSCVVALLVCAWGVLNSMWLKPRRLEKCLRAQGLNGNSYRPFFGDLKELAMMLGEAKSKPISLSDDIVPRVIPFHVKTINKYGTLYTSLLTRIIIKVLSNKKSVY